MNLSRTQIEFTLLYDGLCPLCSKEVTWLYSRNKQEKLGFQVLMKRVLIRRFTVKRTLN